MTGATGATGVTGVTGPSDTWEAIAKGYHTITNTSFDTVTVTVPAGSYDISGTSNLLNWDAANVGGMQCILYYGTSPAADKTTSTMFGWSPPWTSTAPTGPVQRRPQCTGAIQPQRAQRSRSTAARTPARTRLRTTRRLARSRSGRFTDDRTVELPLRYAGLAVVGEPGPAMTRHACRRNARARCREDRPELRFRPYRASLRPASG